MQKEVFCEIIIVNDGSTDNSLAVVENHFKKEIACAHIKIINQSNRGVSVARNKGVEVSKFEYVCFLDADDEWKPGFLKKMAVLIKSYPQADLYCLAHMIKKDNTYLYKPRHGLPDGYNGYVEDFFKTSSKGSVAKSSKVCVKKDAILFFGGFPEGVVAGEDLYVWIRLALNGKVACDMSYLSIVHQQKDNSRKARKNSVPYPIIFFSKNKNYLIERNIKGYLFVVFYKHFVSSLISFKFREAFIRLKAYMVIVF
jgi:glycosyltransferase involved in cell wall biosynthesis